MIYIGYSIFIAISFYNICIRIKFLTKITFCKYESCSIFGAVEGPFKGIKGEELGTVTEDSSIAIYLNKDYYVNNISEEAKKLIDTHNFNIGIVSIDSNGTIDQIVTEEKQNTWTGNVGLANVSDVLKSSINSKCTSTYTGMNGSICNNNFL